MSFIKQSIPALLVLLFACSGMKDDLLPSGSDQRPPIQTGIPGPQVGQRAPDFTLTDTLGNSVTLSLALSGHKAVVLYFTMWCPTCDAHMTDMRSSVIPQHPDVLFYGVDYVSGSVGDSRNAQLAYGYDNSGFIILADVSKTVQDMYKATMGTTVVIDRHGIVQMNEDYKNGSRLRNVLAGLP